MGMKITGSLGVTSRTYLLASILLSVWIGLLLVPASPAEAAERVLGWSGTIKYTHSNEENGWKSVETTTYQVDGTIKVDPVYGYTYQPATWTSSTQGTYSGTFTCNDLSTAQASYSGSGSGTSGMTVDFEGTRYRIDAGYSGNTANADNLNYSGKYKSCETWDTQYAAKQFSIGRFDFDWVTSTPDGSAATTLSGSATDPYFPDSSSSNDETYEWHLTREPDADNDGIPDTKDNCKWVVNPNQVDSDGDGVGNACQGDRDSDTVPDTRDNCPTISNRNQADSDGDGVGDACETKPPVANFTATATGPHTSNAFTFKFDGTLSTDPDGSITSYEWSFGDGTTGTGAIVEHTYTTPGPKYVNLTVTDDKGARSKKKTIRITAGLPVAVFNSSPVVYLHPNESYFPGDPNDFVRNSKLVWSHDNCYDHTLAGLGSVIAQRLGISSETQAYKHKAGCDHDKGSFFAWEHTRPTAKGRDPALANKDGFLLDLDNFYRPGNEGLKIQPPVTYEYQPPRDTNNDGTVDSGYIVYWLFYPFNITEGDQTGNRHEGDWEHVVVRLNWLGEPTQIAYYMHYCDPDIQPLDNVQRIGTHPVVFSTKGGHGSWATAGDHNIVLEGDPLGCGFGTDKTGYGKRWNGTYLLNARSQPWYGFGGGWGELTETKDGNIVGKPPLGPSSYRQLDKTKSGESAFAPEGW